MFLICQEIPPLVSRPNLTILLELRKKIPYQWGFCWRIIKETHWKRRQTHVHQTCPAQSAAFCAGLWHLLSDRGGYSGADGVLSGAGLCRDVLSLSENMGILTTGIVGVSVLVALLSSCVIAYGVGFMLGQRKQEFALYQLMGMELRTVQRMFFGRMGCWDWRPLGWGAVGNGTGG